jgi:hypothetical protein
MTAKRGSSLWVVGGLLVAGLVTTSCGCKAVACGSTETAHIGLDVSAEELASATLTACRDDQCWYASLAGLNEASTTDPFSVPAEPAEPSNQVTLVVRGLSSESSVDIELQWRLRNAELVQPGVVLGAAITSDERGEIFSAMAEVQTFTTDSNACGTAECRNVEVQLVAR